MPLRRGDPEPLTAGASQPARCGAADAQALRPDVPEPPRPHEPHRRLELVAQHAEHPFGAGLPVGGDAPQHGPRQADGPGAERDRLEDVGAPPDAPVEQHLDAVLEPLPAESRRHLLEDLDRAPRVVELAAPVVGDDDARDAGVPRGEQRVLGRLDALEDDREGGQGPEPREVVPAQRRVVEGPQRAHHAAPAVDLVPAHRARRGALKGVAHVGLPPPGDGHVHGHKERLEPERLDPPDDRLGPRAVAADVELEEGGLPRGALRGDLLEGPRGERGDHVDDAGRAGGAHQRPLPLGVRHAHHGAAADVDRERGRLPEDAAARRHAPDADEHAGPEEDPLEGRRALAQRGLGLGARLVVVPRLLGHRSPRRQPHVFEVDDGLQRGHRRLAGALLPPLA
mmetsp:Transcript_633/g.1511  ORF Transcript_633/g.1511 Transcript_633/m.1511 type:complete len:397 (+) Transcript_633:372-1562(+)